jgi:hypothetical protein
MINLEPRTIEILAQVVFKEMCEDHRKSNNPVGIEEFWKFHKEQTLELARNIIRLNKTINP